MTTTNSNTSVSSNHFANLYFDTIGSTPGTGSNFGIEVTNDRAFVPGVPGYYDLSGTGFMFSDTFNAGGQETIEAIIPNNFFINDPLGIFANTPPGTLVSLHLSQSFDFSVVGGGGNYPAPTELGAAIVDLAATTPEPSSLILLGTGVLGLAGVVRRRYLTR